MGNAIVPCVLVLTQRIRSDSSIDPLRTTIYRSKVSHLVVMQWHGVVMDLELRPTRHSQQCYLHHDNCRSLERSQRKIHKELTPKFIIFNKKLLNIDMNNNLFLFIIPRWKHFVMNWPHTMILCLALVLDWRTLLNEKKMKKSCNSLWD